MILLGNPERAPATRRVMTSEQIDIGRLCADNAMVSSQAARPQSLRKK
jgi:hypothetical protein